MYFGYMDTVMVMVMKLGIFSKAAVYSLLQGVFFPSSFPSTGEWDGRVGEKEDAERASNEYSTYTLLSHLFII